MRFKGGWHLTMTDLISVSFAEHVASAQVASIVSGIAAYGNVLDGETPKEFLVEVFRPSKVAKLMTRLNGSDMDS